MQVVDAQIHIWHTGLPSNAAHRQVTSYTAAEAIAEMDAGGVDAAIIHPPSWDPESFARALQAVQDYPGRFAILGGLSWDAPAGPQAVAERIGQWRAQPGVLGLRYLFLGDQARQVLRDRQLDWLWNACQEAKVPVSTLATDVLAELGGVAERFPGLRLSIDHMGGRGGTAPLRDDAAMVHMPELLKLARLPNIAVKATGAPGYSSEPYPFRPMHDYLWQIFDAFGPERMFWGTDITKMPCPWSECVRMFTEELPWLKGEDLRLVMGAAVKNWWGWPD